MSPLSGSVGPAPFQYSCRPRGPRRRRFPPAPPAARHRQHHNPDAPGQSERHETSDPVRSDAV